MSDTILHKLKKNQSGKTVGWGSKDQKYLEEKSRESVEHHNPDSYVLFFEVDYENSKKNFYGELTHKKFKSPQGVKIHGIISIAGEENKYENGIVLRNTNMELGVYLSHLVELEINPQLGEYFFCKNKWYVIHSKTALDDNQTSVAFDKAITVKFLATQVDDEAMGYNQWFTENNLNPEVKSYLDQKRY